MTSMTGQLQLQSGQASPTLRVAMLSFFIAGGTTALEEQYVRPLAKPPVKWNAQEAIHASFQSLGVFHSTISPTTTIAAEDPWDELERLEAGWDGNNAAAVSLDAIKHAKRFTSNAHTIGVSFTPFADPDGSVGLEARKSGKVAYLIVSADDRFTYVLREGDKVHRGDNVDASTIRELLALLY